MITVTLVRHGESEDNKRANWAGWKDAPLSDLGIKQALAVGSFFSLAGTRIDVVYASPSLRATATGEYIQDAHSTPKPPLISNPKLREQHFGVAEGQPWTLERPSNTSIDELAAKRLFPPLYGRAEKFPEGESLDDLAQRAEEAISECIVPYLTRDGAHIVIASHGLCIAELVGALLRLDPEFDGDENYRGLDNTGWTRVVVSIKDGHSYTTDSDKVPPLDVRVTDVNRTDHLAALEEEARVVSEEQRRQRNYFGGNGK